MLLFTKRLSGPTIHDLLQDTDLIGEINSVYNFTHVSLCMNSLSLPKFPLLSSSPNPRKSKPHVQIWMVKKFVVRDISICIECVPVENNILLFLSFREQFCERTLTDWWVPRQRTCKEAGGREPSWGRHLHHPPLPERAAANAIGSTPAA